MRMQSLAILLTLAIAGTNPADADAAYADWQRLGKGHYAYASVADQRSEPAKERMAGQLAFVCASLSSKSNLDGQLPVRITDDVYRLDLQGLGWAAQWPIVLKRHYKYRPDLTPHRYPLIVSAAWIVAELPDPIKTPGAAHLLLYGRELKSAKEFRSFWGWNTKSSDAFGFIEGTSGVQADNLSRLMSNFDTANRTRGFETFDSKIVAGKQDPIEKPIPGTLIYDGAELITGIPKFYNGEGGSLQAYFLSQGNSDPKKFDLHVNAAPIDLVKDTEGLRGLDIRDNIDCMGCHAFGPKYPTLNAYKSYLLSGAKIYSDKITKAEIERFYQSPFIKELERQEEEFRAAIRLVNGLTAEKNNANFKACIKEYDEPLSLAQAAREVYSTPEELRNAIADYAPSGKLTARLAALAHGQAISRDQWIVSQPLLQLVILPAWRRKSVMKTTPLLKQRGLTIGSMKENEMAEQMLAEVEYRDIPNFPGYRAGSDGTIWSHLSGTWKKRKPGLAGKGYLAISLHVDQVSHRYVHRLVLETFVGPCPDGMEACHNNGDRTDNRLVNLRWDTSKANNHDKLSHGTNNSGEKHGLAKLTDADAKAIHRDYEAGEVSHKALAAKYGISRRVVSRILRGESWSHVRVSHEPRRPANQKLTFENAIEIRQQHKAGETQDHLAAAYGVSRATISMVVNGKTWNRGDKCVA
jgi:hypothetical protein